MLATARTRLSGIDDGDHLDLDHESGAKPVFRTQPSRWAGSRKARNNTFLSLAAYAASAFSSQGPSIANRSRDQTTGVVLRGTESLLTHRWREMDSNFWYRGRKARDFRNIPEAAGMAGVRYG